jgi:hypothetical protein
MATRAFYRQFGLVQHEAEGHPFYQVGGGMFDVEPVRAVLQQVFRTDQVVADATIEHGLGRLGHRRLAVNGTRMAVADGSQVAVLAIEDITDGSKAAP